MNKTAQRLFEVLLAGIVFNGAHAFESGSTGADGDFNPIVSVEVQLPPNGVLHYRSVNIPSGVTVTFKKNAANTPVTMLVQGSAVIAGRIDISGSNGTPTGLAANGSQMAEGIPGRGGPGGFDGGRGGPPGTAVPGPKGTTLGSTGGAGLGPGGGGAGICVVAPTGGQIYSPCPVGGGGFRYRGMAGSAKIGDYYPTFVYSGGGGAAYGNEFILPLIGGSGGGGGGGGNIFHGSGGGGGGGAILIAVSGRLDFTGAIVANGGAAGPVLVNGERVDVHGCGGGGSGGAVRLVATTMAGNGKISVAGALATPWPHCRDYTYENPPNGGDGWSRMESEFALRPVAGLPQPIFIPNSPSLRFVSVGGNAVPAIPGGESDVVLPQALPNPVPVVLGTTAVPVGSVIHVRQSPRLGMATAIDAPPTTGTDASATTSVGINIPEGHSTLSASVSFAITVAQGDALSRFAQGERVEKVTLTATMGQGSTALLETGSGKTFEVPADALQIAGM